MKRSDLAGYSFSFAILGFSISLLGAVVYPHTLRYLAYGALVFGFVFCIAFGVFCYEISSGR